MCVCVCIIPAYAMLVSGATQPSMHMYECVLQKKVTKNNTSECDACQQCHAGLRQDSSSPI